MQLVLSSAILAILAALGEAAADPRATSEALATDDSCLETSLHLMQKNAGRPVEAQAQKAAVTAKTVCEGKADERGRCAVRLFVGGQGQDEGAPAAGKGAALVQVVAGDFPIPTAEGRYPQTNCLEVFDAGEGLTPRLRLRASPCQVGVVNQEFVVEPSSFRLLWEDRGTGFLCLTTFLDGAAFGAGFATCHYDVDSIFDFDQTFQLVGRSMMAVCQCRCEKSGPCPIPCSFNTACLHTGKDGSVQNVVQPTAEQFWNKA